VKIYSFNPSSQPSSPESVETSKWIDQYSEDLKILLVEGKYENSKRFNMAAESLKLRAEIKHQNITPLLCFQKQANSNTLFAAYQNTENSLNVRKIDTFKEVLKMTFHILQALAYLQEKSCLHGDIRPGNIAFFQKENLYKLNEMFVIDKMPKEVNLNYIKGILKTLDLNF
jgi:serine/threonine protein kinase